MMRPPALKRRTPIVRLICVALVCVTSACGSKLPIEEIAAADGRSSSTDAASTGATGGAAEVAVGPGAGPGDATATGGQSTSGVGVGGIGATPGGATDPGSGSLPAACTGPGTPIRIGQVGTFSGLVGQSVGGSRTGLAVWAADVNARGGLACHPVEIFQRDDQSDPAQSAAALQDLVQNEDVTVMVGSNVPLSITGYERAANDAGIITIGGDQASQTAWNTNPLFYAVGTATNAGFYGSIRATVEAGYTRIAVLYCVEAASVCPPLKRYIVDQGGAAAAGATIVYEAPVSLTQPDFTAACQNAKDAGADFVFLGVDGASDIRFANSCARIGYSPPIATLSIGTGFDPHQPALQAATMYVASSSFPWMVSDSPSAQRYQAALKQYAPSAISTGSMAGAFTSGLMLEKAIANLGDAARTQDITQDLILQGLGMVENETLDGAIAPITYRPGQASTMLQRCYFIARLTVDGWTAPQGGKYSCMPDDAPI